MKLSQYWYAMTVSLDHLPLLRGCVSAKALNVARVYRSEASLSDGKASLGKSLNKTHECIDELGVYIGITNIKSKTN